MRALVAGPEGIETGIAVEEEQQLEVSDEILAQDDIELGDGVCLLRCEDGMFWARQLTDGYFEIIRPYRSKP